MTDLRRQDRRQQLTGIALVMAATLSWSLTGFFTRILTTDVWTTMAYRSAFGALFLIIAFVATNGRGSLARFMSMGAWGVAHSVASVVCAIFTITSLYHTSVADNAVIGAASPFAAAFLARIFLGEKVPTRTLVAGATSLVGVGVVVSGSLGKGHLFGDVLAVGMMLSFASMIVISRAKPSMPVTPPNILAVLINFAVTAPLASFGSVGLRDGALLAGFGFTNFMLAGMLFLAGSRRIPAAESALIVALDLIFGPAVVWVVFGEAPTLAGLVGGAIVLASVAGHVVAGEWKARH